MSASRQTARSRTTVRRTVNAVSGLAGERHVAGACRVTDSHEGKQVDVVPSETVKVLEEQLQLLTGQRLVASLVSHGLTVPPLFANYGRGGR